jgi:hypothetical protein
MIGFDFLVVSMDGGSFGQTNIRMGYIALLIVAFLAYRGNPVFTYDSDGEVIILDSKNPSLAFVSSVFNRHYEFPKRKLVGYSFSMLPFRKTLTLKISSKDGKRKTLSVNMSYISKQDLKDLERSLRGIISRNKKDGFIQELEQKDVD